MNSKPLGIGLLYWLLLLGLGACLYGYRVPIISEYFYFVAAFVAGRFSALVLER